MKREYSVVDVTIVSGAAVSEAIDFRRYNSGIIIGPSAWTAANLGFQVSENSDADFVRIGSSASASVEITAVPAAASIAWALPSGLAGAKFFRLWSKNTGSDADVNQGGDRAFTLILKS